MIPCEQILILRKTHQNIGMKYFYWWDLELVIYSHSLLGQGNQGSEKWEHITAEHGKWEGSRVCTCRNSLEASMAEVCHPRLWRTDTRELWNTASGMAFIHMCPCTQGTRQPVVYQAALVRDSFSEVPETTKASQPSSQSTRSQEGKGTGCKRGAWGLYSDSHSFSPHKSGCLSPYPASL